MTPSIGPGAEKAIIKKIESGTTKRNLIKYYFNFGQFIERGEFVELVSYLMFKYSIFQMKAHGNKLLDERQAFKEMIKTAKINEKYMFKYIHTTPVTLNGSGPYYDSEELILQGLGEGVIQTKPLAKWICPDGM
ncbi:MAG: hypothetical protein ACQ9ET_00070 [Nitrosomonadaceae bacterium]